MFSSFLGLAAVTMVQVGKNVCVSEKQSNFSVSLMKLDVRTLLKNGGPGIWGLDQERSFGSGCGF